MQKSASLERNDYHKRAQKSIAETVTQIDSQKTISKNLTPGYMLTGDKRGENKRILKQTADWGKQTSRKDMGLRTQERTCPLSIQEEEHRAIREH